jgi:molecular chaperone DnaK
VPQIEVAFNIDVNGILSVTAKDLGTGKSHSVKVEQSGGLSKEEIERKLKEAEAHADEDAKKRKLAEAKNQASSLTYQTEKLVKEHADKLDAASKSAIEAAVAKVKEKAEGEDPAAIDAAIEELNQATHALSKHMYEQAGATGGQPGAGAAPGAGAGSAGGDDVIDAEFEKK